jgi:uncharacterized lipoprotein NlpE involved in copper resistance
MRIFLAVMLFQLAACGADTTESTESYPTKPDGDPVVDAAHNSRNALDWPGTYTGILPCADCEGIRTTVTLRDDGTFERERLYLGKSNAPMNDSGQFSWNDAGSIVTLTASDSTTQMYQVGENQLFHLDSAGNRISGDLAARYVLRQTVGDPRIEDRKWLLTEVMGQAYAPSDDGREAFLLLDGELNRASGNNSCNNFFGGYVIETGQRIRFAENMGATMMACPDTSTEQSFMEALRTVDNYSVSGDELSLNKARMAPLLRFELATETD